MKIKNYPLRIPGDLHHKIRIFAAVDNTSMREFIQKTLKEEVERRERRTKGLV